MRVSLKIRWLTGWWMSQPLGKKYETVGMMKFPTEWKNVIHVPNHQPVKG
jgi:hypothetical protein